MVATLAPSVSVPPRERLWAAVEAAYQAVRLAQVEHGDLSHQARAARRAVSQAWIAYESGAYVGLPAKPITVHRPLLAEVEIQLAVDLDDVGYTVTLTLDGHGSDAADVTMAPEPDMGRVALLALAAINTLADLEGAAASRDDVRSADLWSRAIIALTLWRQGWIEAQIMDAGNSAA